MKFSPILMTLTLTAASWAQVAKPAITSARNAADKASRPAQVAGEKQSKAAQQAAPAARPAAQKPAAPAQQIVRTAAVRKAVTPVETARHKPSAANSKTKAAGEKTAIEKPTGAKSAVASKPRLGDETGTVRGHKRDPFLTLVRPVQANVPQCTTGKQCLVPDELVLRGIVTEAKGRVAVIEHSRKTYFLHEKDPVFLGEVVKITGDSVLFRETKTDRAGKRITREITKRIGVGAATEAAAEPARMPNGAPLPESITAPTQTPATPAAAAGSAPEQKAGGR